TVIIRDQCQRRITNFRLAREFCFLQIRHPDNVHAPRTVNIRFRDGREGGSLHADVRTAAMRLYLCGLTRVFKHIAQRLAHRMSESYVRYDPIAEKSRLRNSRARPIEKLIGDYHVEWRVLFLQRTNCRS